jgi:hypothetical protein
MSLLNKYRKLKKAYNALLAQLQPKKSVAKKKAATKKAAKKKVVKKKVR